MSSADKICRKIYDETKSYYKSNIDKGCHLGFKILYGPPTPKPPILFIGYQPGGGEDEYREELAEGAHDGWPKECEYATKKWTLASNMQKMFGEDLLKKCTGLNAIFFRSPRIGNYTNDVNKEYRSSIELFCIPRVEEMIKAIQPQRIIAIGFKTLDILYKNEIPYPNLVGRNNKRVLIRKGKIAGQDALATLHLSGARISSIDRESISEAIKKIL